MKITLSLQSTSSSTTKNFNSTVFVIHSQRAIIVISVNFHSNFAKFHFTSPQHRTRRGNRTEHWLKKGVPNTEFHSWTEDIFVQNSLVKVLLLRVFPKIFAEFCMQNLEQHRSHEVKNYWDWIQWRKGWFNAFTCFQGWDLRFIFFQE